MIKKQSFISAFMALTLILLPVLACKVPKNNTREGQGQRGNRETPSGGNPESPNGNQGTPSGSYVGNINGAEAVANVSFEPLREYTIMSGEIRSSNFYYTFTADIVGSSGYGDITSHNDNERFRIKIDLTQDGFILTSNPFGPGTPSSYKFVRR